MCRSGRLVKPEPLVVRLLVAPAPPGVLCPPVDLWGLVIRELVVVRNLPSGRRELLEVADEEPICWSPWE